MMHRGRKCAGAAVAAACLQFRKLPAGSGSPGSSVGRTRADIRVILSSHGGALTRGWAYPDRGASGGARLFRIIDTKQGGLRAAASGRFRLSGFENKSAVGQIRDLLGNRGIAETAPRVRSGCERGPHSRIRANRLTLFMDFIGIGLTQREKDPRAFMVME